MPKGYIIARVTVTDPDAFAAYVAATNPVVEQYGGRPLVRGGAVAALEGESRGRNTVIEFDSFEGAQAYFNSPEYQAAKALRAGAALIDIIAVEGV